MAGSSGRHRPSPETLLRLAFWAILLGVASYTRTDPDLWGHVRFGLDIARDLTIPRIDPYSFTADREWINHEWAAEALTGTAFGLAGDAGLVLLKLTVIALVLGLLSYTLRREGVRAALRRDVIAGLAIVTTVEQAHHVRPQLFSLLCFSVVLWCLMQVAREERPRWLLAVPPLFMVWANLHGGWIVGGGVLVVWIVGLAIGGAIRPAIWCVAAGIASLAATLVTPYGFELWLFFRETVGFGRADIREWQPIYALDPHMWILWAATLGMAAVGIVRTGRANMRPERVLVVATLALTSLQVNRLLAFFALATLFLFGARIADAAAWRHRAPAARERRTTHIALVAAALLIATLSVPVIALNVARVEVDPRTTPEPGAVEFFRNPSRDGRRETTYSPGIRDRHLRFYFNLPGGVTLPRDLEADYVWIPGSVPAATRLRMDSQWTLVYEGEKSAIFEHVARHRSTVPVKQTVAVRSRSFPGP